MKICTIGVKNISKNSLLVECENIKDVEKLRSQVTDKLSEVEAKIPT